MSKLVRATVPMCQGCGGVYSEHDSGGWPICSGCKEQMPPAVECIDLGVYVDDAPDAALREVVREVEEILATHTAGTYQALNVITKICADRLLAALADKAEEGHDESR